mmetsp:Transcript_32849/g.75627  ORF Transcript_32849/g.75627 Transcript_32849/m.75627 type:complete len:162 (+) Transcript_32849:1189-1674(+)
MFANVLSMLCSRECDRMFGSSCVRCCTTNPCVYLHFGQAEVCNTESCSCVACGNDSIYNRGREHAVMVALSRSTSAFAQSRPTKRERREAKMESTNLRVCHCRKSRCVKKYCDCFFVGVRCNSRCQCLDCSNTGATNDYADNVPKAPGRTEKAKPITNDIA